MRDTFTICALFYGDHCPIAERLLNSLRAVIPGQDLNLRVGTNAIGSPTRNLLELYGHAGYIRPDLWYDSRENRCKYPLMRDMLYDPDRPITTPYVMWFDDDSYLDANAGKPVPWLEKVATAMESADVLGSIYSIGWQGNQQAWIKAQPWYNGKDPAARKGTRFATGGWWCIRTEVLQRFDYPWPQLHHRGGDVMLGELCFQQDLRLCHFRDGVHINADELGRESRATRRGHDESPIGVGFIQSVARAVHLATEPRPQQAAGVDENPPSVDIHRTPTPRRPVIIELD